MINNPKYDGDVVNLGYLNNRLNSEKTTNDEKINSIPKNYNSPPVPPYYQNSLLLLNGQIYKCIKSRLIGSFNMSDWNLVVSTNEVEEALKYIYDINKLEYVDQIDGIIETFYQNDDPSLEWTTDIEKSKHVSDLWTIDTSLFYQYEKKTTNPVAYGWKKVSVPVSLFDVIDGYKKIFIEQPSNYEKDDLWLGNVTKIAIESSDEFNEDHWIIRDDFIESNQIEQEEYHKVYLLPKITEINRQTVSEIKKAIDEIILRVSKEYTTKTEVEKYVDDIKTETAETYTTKTEMSAQLSLTANQLNIAIAETKSELNDTNKAINQMNYSFDTKEFKVNSLNDPNNTSMNNKGVQVYNYTTLKSVLNEKGAGFDDLIVTSTAQIGYLKFVKAVDENGEKVTDIHHLVSNVQTVEDLVGDN